MQETSSNLHFSLPSRRVLQALSRQEASSTMHFSLPSRRVPQALSRQDASSTMHFSLPSRRVPQASSRQKQVLQCISLFRPGILKSSSTGILTTHVHGVHLVIFFPPSLSYPREQRTYVTQCANNNYRRPSIAAKKNVDGHDRGESFGNREDSVEKSRIASSSFLLQLQSSIVRSSSLCLFLGGAVLAFGLLQFCKPAFAKDINAPPTLTATLNNSGEVEVQESIPSERSPHELDDNVVVARGRVQEEETLGSSEGVSKAFEPSFGEGSDLTNDPAEVLLRSYLDTHPSDKKALQALLFLRLKKGEVNASLFVLRKLIELEPENLEWKYIRAQAHEYAGDMSEARRGFEEILQSKPLSARALQGLAVVMHKTGEEEQALQILAEAVQKAVDSGQSKEAINLRMLLGQLHVMQGNIDQAMELYKTVVEEDPKDYRPYLCKGLAYSIIGEEAEAAKQFQKYRKLCPKNIPYRGFLDEMMLKAKSESQRLNRRMEEEELKIKGQKIPKVMRQPLATGGRPLDNNNSA